MASWASAPAATTPSPPPAHFSKPTWTPRPSPRRPWLSPPTFLCTPMNISPSTAFPQTPDPAGPKMTTFSPREIVSELDRFIIGQADAKRAVAIALRNRWRRQQLTGQMREEVLPKNILMVGPTGVGKTEISRRLARLAGAPFLKIEATK